MALYINRNQVGRTLTNVMSAIQSFHVSLSPSITAANVKTKLFSYIRLSFLWFFILVIVCSRVRLMEVMRCQCGLNEKWDGSCFYSCAYAMKCPHKSADIKHFVNAHQLSYIFHQFFNDFLLLLLL